MGLFDKPKASPQPGSKPYKLEKRVEVVMTEIKQRRAEHCQRLGFNATRIGQDLRYIEKKTQELYTVAVKELKSGATVTNTFQNLYDNHTVLDVDRDIVERMFAAR